MKTKEQGWIKGTFKIKLAYEDEPKQIENGRIYKHFGLDMSFKSRKELYHIPTKTRLGIYELKLQEIKELVDRLLEVNIDWVSSDVDYFQNIADDIKKQINKIIRSV